MFEHVWKCLTMLFWWSRASRNSTGTPRRIWRCCSTREINLHREVEFRQLRCELFWPANSHGCVYFVIFSNILISGDISGRFCDFLSLVSFLWLYFCDYIFLVIFRAHLFAQCTRKNGLQHRQQLAWHWNFMKAHSSFRWRMRRVAYVVRGSLCDAVRCNEFDVKHADAHPPDLPCFVLLVDLASAHGERDVKINSPNHGTLIKASNLFVWALLASNCRRFRWCGGFLVCLITFFGYLVQSSSALPNCRLSTAAADWSWNSPGRVCWHLKLDSPRTPFTFQKF